MKSLIIGAAGFVGGYLIDELAQHCVIAASEPQSPETQEVTATKLAHEAFEHNRCKVINLDILDEGAISSVLDAERPDAVFHLAAQSSVGVSWKNPQLTVDVNIKGTVNLLETLRKADYGGRVLLIGSAEEYGKVSKTDNPIGENAHIRPVNIYAATKACQNMLGRIYYLAYGLDIVMVRAFNHTGPGQLPGFVVADFCKQAAEIEAGLREPVIYTGNLSAKRDFTDVRDVVRAYCALMKDGKTGETYNVGSGKAVAISEILDMIIAASSAQIRHEIDTAKFRPVDEPILEADISKLVADTDWRPKITLETTINETLDYWRNQVNR